MKILLHICCGVCAAGAASQLIEEGHDVTGYFFNPNIHPSAEYARRLEATKTVAHELNFPLIVGKYDPRQWLRDTAPLADEKEGGKRCLLCFNIRLQATFACMQEAGADAFTTTLTIGPKKSAEAINHIGRDIGGERFLQRNFKKKDGFKKANEISRRLGLYRQSYCGCIYSLKERKLKLERGAKK